VVLHELNELTFSFGRRIPSARRHFFVWPAHSITVPPFFVRPAHSITAPPFLCSAGDQHHHSRYLSAIISRLPLLSAAANIKLSIIAVALDCHRILSAANTISNAIVIILLPGLNNPRLTG
jgi:hypothetical protein